MGLVVDLAAWWGRCRLQKVSPGRRHFRSWRSCCIPAVVEPVLGVRHYSYRCCRLCSNRSSTCSGTVARLVRGGFPGFRPLSPAPILHLLFSWNSISPPTHQPIVWRAAWKVWCIAQETPPDSQAHYDCLPVGFYQCIPFTTLRTAILPQLTLQCRVAWDRPSTVQSCTTWTPPTKGLPNSSTQTSSLPAFYHRRLLEIHMTLVFLQERHAQNVVLRQVADNESQVDHLITNSSR